MPVRTLATRRVPGGARAAGSAAAAILAGAAMVGLGALAAIVGPLVAVAVPAAIVGAIAAARWPSAAVITVFLLAGAAGTITAFTPFPPVGIADLLLAALWLGVAWTYLRGRQERQVWLWPALLAPFLYLVLTAATIPTSDALTDAIESFRLAGWHMLAFVLIAVAPWPEETFGRIARGMIAVAAVVGSYAVYRKIAGPANEELALAKGAIARVEPGQEPELFGSFFGPQDLAGWGATMVPFGLALVLGWRDWWRLPALIAVGTAAFALLAADRRAAAVGVALGVALVIGLYLASRAFGGRRFGIGLAAVVTIAVGAAGVYSVTIATSTDSAERFEGLISDPIEQDTFQTRLSSWELALDETDEHPFGVGLGEVGEIGEGDEVGPPIAPGLDSSYLKVALEQGLPVMVLFIGALIALLLALAWRAITTDDPRRATLAIAACGTLVAMAAVFFTSFYIERAAALAGWIVVGLGAAQFTTAPRRPEERGVGRRAVTAVHPPADRTRAPVPAGPE